MHMTMEKGYCILFFRVEEGVKDMKIRKNFQPMLASAVGASCDQRILHRQNTQRPFVIPLARRSKRVFGLVFDLIFNRGYPR